MMSVLLAAALAACTADTPGPGPATTGAEPACDRTLDAAFGAWARSGFSGSVAISTGGRFECLAGYGSANDATGTRNTPDTVFSIGSVTKAVTAATVFGLVDDGKLTLDDRAGRLLPELAGPVRAATVRQLLLHTSGLTGSHGEDYRPLSRDAAVAALGRLRLAFPPGTGHAYSNGGYTLLALIIEKLSGRSYRDYTASRILSRPGGRVAGGFWNGTPAAAGPRAVGYLDGGGTGQRGDFGGPHWALDGNGGLAMTARQLASWTHALFTGAVVSGGSVAAIGRPGFDLGDGRSETPGWVALAAKVHGMPVLMTAGGGGDVGHNVVVAWLPERQRAVVVTSNRPGMTAEKLLGAIGPALFAGDPVPVPGTSAGAVDGAGIVGTYRLGTGGSFEVTARDGRMEISAHGADGVAALLPPRGVPPGDVRRHAERVSALLAGRTGEGRTERGLIESEFGPITAVTPAGTILADGELRSYVTVTTGGRSVLGWYAVDANGGVQGAELPTGAPALSFVRSGDHYRPDDPTGGGPEVTVAFAGDRMTVTGPAGGTTARRAG